jgi:hypothetical protein
MWEHRNSVLHKDPTRHFTRDQLDLTNQEIVSEWQTGDQGLLAQDRFLFRDRAGVDSKSLPQKLEWLNAVAMARTAAAANDANRQSFEHKREGLCQWLLSPTNRVPRNGPQTRKKITKTNTKTKKATKTTQKRLHVQPDPSARTLATNELNQNTNGINKGE